MKKILIADDAQSVVKLEEVILKRLKCEILTATDGAETLKKIQQEKPDVVLLDYAMPGMTGDLICRFIKNNPELSQIKVIIITARGDTDTEERCLKAGCDFFMKKPISHRELMQVVKRYL